MNWLKRLAGILAMLLGSIGSIACGVGIAGTWIARARIDATVDAISSSVDSALQRTQKRSDETFQRVAEIRESTGDVLGRIHQRLTTRRTDQPDRDEALKALGREALAKCDATRDWVSLVQTGIDFAEQLQDLLEATSLMTREDVDSLAELRRVTQSGRQELETLGHLAKQLQANLAKVQSPNAANDDGKLAQELGSLRDQMNDAMRRLEDLGPKIQSALDQTRTDVAVLEGKIQHQMLLIAALVSLLLLWGLASQISLAAHGWHFLRTKASPTSVETDGGSFQL